MVKASFPLI
jgi:hypothetical protein